MLFLLNDMIVDVAVPEVHVLQCWRTLGCGDPRSLRAQDAIAFTVDAVEKRRSVGVAIDRDFATDLAALIITKTGANSLILKPTASGSLEPRLRHVPNMVLETYQRGAANDGAMSERLKA